MEVLKTVPFLKVILKQNKFENLFFGGEKMTYNNRDRIENRLNVWVHSTLNS